MRTLRHKNGTRAMKWEDDRQPSVSRGKCRWPSVMLVAICLLSASCEGDPAVGTTRNEERFEMAGVIEGFYGTPWSHQDRLDILTFMGGTALNAYVYAPKNDPYHLTRWRDPYPAEEFASLRELVTRAEENGVDFWFAISPGLSMEYGSEEDYQTLLRKIDTVSQIGVRHFGLFLDDVSLELANEPDRQRFGSLADAHVFLINKLWSDLSRRGFELMVTPTIYTSAWDNPAYINRIGEGVASDVLLVWTGPDVATSRISAEGSMAWSTRLRRRIVLWDNYPVNDYAPWRVFLGPFRGRDGRLPESTVGILANPMNQAQASLLALRTLSDYVEQPANYDPDVSILRAQRELLGPHAVDAIQTISAVFDDYAPDPNAFEPLYFLRDTIDLREIESRLSPLYPALDSLGSRSDDPVYAQKLANELKPILDRNASRIESLESDPRYRQQGRHLVFNMEAETFRVPDVPHDVAIDGSLSEWADASWIRLHGEPRTEVVFGSNDSLLTIAVRVHANNVSANSGAQIGEGAHIQLVIAHDSPSNWISPQDLFVLIAPGDDTGAGQYVGSMRFEGFMAKWLADNESLRLTSFHLTTFGVAPAEPVSRIANGLRHATRIHGDGYSAEIEVPYQPGTMRVSLNATARVNGRLRTSALASRNYPANPATFVRLSLR